MYYAIEPGIIPKIKLEYLQGKGSVREIGEKFGVKKTRTLEMRAYKEKWREQRENHLAAVSENGLKRAELRAKAWEARVYNALIKEWDLVTHSIKNMGSQIDPEAIVVYARALKLIDDMARRSLGLRDPSQRLDMISEDKSLGDSFANALIKLKTCELPAPTSDEVDRILEAEIIEDEAES